MVSPGPQAFPLFWGARGISQFGDEISMLALPWLIAATTASPLAVGALEALLFLPVAILGLPLGVFADRRSRRTSMVQADALRLVMLLSIAVAAWVGLGPHLSHVLGAVLIIGIAHALFEASAQAFLPDIVSQDAIVDANARLSFTEGLCIVAGPATAGVLIATVGASGAIAVDAATFGLSLLAILLIGRLPERLSAREEPIRVAMRDGVQVITSNRHLRALTVLVASSNIGAAFITGLAVFFLQRTLHLDGWRAGVVYAVNGVGAIAASLIVPRISTRIGLGRSVLAGMTVAGLGACLLPFATKATWFITATTAFILIGLGVVTLVVSSASIRQKHVSGHILGRVTATYRTVVNGALVVGALIGGLIAQFVGLRAALGVGAGIYGVTVICGLLSPLNSDDPPEPASSS